MAEQVTGAASATIPGGIARFTSSALKQGVSSATTSTVKAEVAKPEIQAVQIDPVEMQKKLQTSPLIYWTSPRTCYTKDMTAIDTAHCGIR